MSAAIDQLKSSNIGTINHVLSTVLLMITTNLSKTEVLNLASNALTYLIYPIEQLRLPEDGAYSDAMVMIGGMEASVLRPDLEANSDALRCVYETGPDRSHRPDGSNRNRSNRSNWSYRTNGRNLSLMHILY